MDGEPAENRRGHARGGLRPGDRRERPPLRRRRLRRHGQGLRPGGGRQIHSRPDDRRPPRRVQLAAPRGAGGQPGDRQPLRGRQPPAPYAEEPDAQVDVFDPGGSYLGVLKYQIVDALPSGLTVDNSAAQTQGRVYVTSGNTNQAGIYGYGANSQIGSSSPPSIGLVVRRAGQRRGGGDQLPRRPRLRLLLLRGSAPAPPSPSPRRRIRARPSPAGRAGGVGGPGSAR